MSREWKPGDVAMVGGMYAFYTDGNEGPMFTFRDGSRARAAVVPADPGRRLLVIDPEDTAQLCSLAHAIDCAVLPDPCYVFTPTYYRVQAALRSLLTPPKPDEPQGLGAVVRDDQGKTWVKVGKRSDWYQAHGKWSVYADLAVVEVLSEGVTR